jgi:hypothetical protein
MNSKRTKSRSLTRAYCAQIKLGPTVSKIIRGAMLSRFVFQEIGVDAGTRLSGWNQRSIWSIYEEIKIVEMNTIILDAPNRLQTVSLEICTIQGQETKVTAIRSTFTTSKLRRPERKYLWENV